MKDAVRQLLRDLINWIRKFLREKFGLRNANAPFYLSILAALIVFGITITGFIEITDSLFEDELGPFDEAVSEYVISFRSPALNSFFSFITNLGDRNVYIAMIAALALFFWLRFKNLEFTFEIIVVLVVTSLSNIAIKQAINRSRPATDGHLVEVNSLSFPSGHSMSAMAFYGLLIYLCIHYKLRPWVRFLLIALLTLLILLIGISRVYLGVHYPSDVAAGYLGGLIWVSFAVILYNILELWRKRKHSKAREPEKES